MVTSMSSGTLWKCEHCEKCHITETASMPDGWTGDGCNTCTSGPYSTEGTADHTLETLAALERARKALETEMHRHVAVARASGIGWADLGDAVGMSKQATHYRFTKAKAATTPTATK